MGWFKDLFCGTPQNGVGGNGPAATKLPSVAELYNCIELGFKEHPKLYALLEVDHISPYSGMCISKRLHLVLTKDGDIGAYRITADIGDYYAGQVLTSGNILNHVADDYTRANKQKLVLDWKLTWLTPDTIPKVTEALVTNALASAIPFTARQVFEGSYVTDKTSGPAAIYRTGPTQIGYTASSPGDIPYWYTDLAFNEGFLKLPTDPNKYIITDQYAVDKGLLPKTHWRRWVEISTAQNNAKAAIKYVPRDNCCGYVKYFDVAFNFNDPDLAGMSFDSGQLLSRTIGHLQHTLDQELPDKSFFTGEITISPAKSDIYIEPEQVKVVWMDEVVPLQEYLDQQREAETNLEKPYLAPNIPTANIGGNKFAIDADYYINFTPWSRNK